MKEFQNLKIYEKLIISAIENKTINHQKQSCNDFEIQLARKLRTDVLNIYRKIISLGAPDTCAIVMVAAIIPLLTPCGLCVCLYYMTQL